MLNRIGQGRKIETEFFAESEGDAKNIGQSLKYSVLKYSYLSVWHAFRIV